MLYVWLFQQGHKGNRLKGIKFYRIPVDKEKWLKWLKWLRAINRQDFDPPSDACICSVNFVGGRLAIDFCVDCN